MHVFHSPNQLVSACRWQIDSEKSEQEANLCMTLVTKPARGEMNKISEQEGRQVKQFCA